MATDSNFVIINTVISSGRGEGGSRSTERSWKWQSGSSKEMVVAGVAMEIAILQVGCVRQSFALYRQMFVCRPPGIYHPKKPIQYVRHNGHHHGFTNHSALYKPFMGFQQDWP